MAKLFNRAKMTTSTTGSGTVTLSSAANGFQSFADAGVSDGDVIQYVIEEGSAWEIGTGTYSASGTSLTRTPSESSNSGSAISLGGTAKVSITTVAADLNRLQNAGSDIVTVSAAGAAVTGNITVTGTVDGVDIATRDGVLTSTTTTANAALPKAGGTMTGAITFAAGQTFDGRDVSADGSKLDGIESGADVTDTTNVVAALTAGTNVTIAADGTISSTDTNTTYSAGTNLSLSGTTFNVSSNPSFTDVYVADQILHTGDTNTYMQFHTNDQWRVVVAGTERLEVKNSSPHVLVTGDINSTSDARLKENVEPIENALADVAQLEGVSFDWKDTGTRGHGFIAQQVEPILPNVVQTDEKTGIKSINYVGMIGHLVEAIKELKAEIEELKR